MRTQITILSIFALLIAPLAAQAKPTVLASSNSSQRFMALDRGTPVSAPVKVRKVRNRRASGLHSDIDAMDEGFLRLDRTMLVVNRSKKREPVSVPQTEVLESAGLLKPDLMLSNDPILDLFGTDGADSGAEFGVTRRGERLGKGAYGWPVALNVQQRISSGYGTRSDPFTGKKAFHAGIDIAAAAGTPVLAAASGKVQYVGVSKRYGKFVSIAHADGKVSWYGHLSNQSVEKGQLVRQGQALGNIGTTGRSTGPHLDFRVKDGDKFVNPALLLGQAPRSMHVAQNAATR